MTQRKSSGSPSGGQESKAEAVREQTSDVGRDVMNAGGKVAQTAVGQGKEVAAETSRQARSVLDQAYARMKEEADAQQRRAAERLRTLGDELQSMCGRGEQQDTAGMLARQASGVAHQMADWLQQREPGEVLNELRQYARRHPGMFLAGATFAGALAGRLTRNLAAPSGMAGGVGRGGEQPAQRPPSAQPAAMAPPPAPAVEPTGQVAADLPGGQPVRPVRAPQAHAEAR